MATITRRRGYALGGRTAFGAPRIQFPLSSGQTGRPGYLVTVSSGKGTLTKAASAEILGLLESYHDNSADGEMATVSLFVPGAFFEFSLNGTNAAATLRGTVVAFEDPGGSYDFATAGDSASTGFCIVHFGADQGVWESHRFIGEYDTSETSGATNVPQADLGGVGDDYPRVIGVPDVSATVLG